MRDDNLANNDRNNKYSNLFLKELEEVRTEFLSLINQRETNVELENEFNESIKFFIDVYGYSIRELVDSYLFIHDMMLQEQLFFTRNNDYRNHTYAEVAENVYMDQKYMQKYMCGLFLSEYMWNQHIKMNLYIEEQIRRFDKNGRYLEIAPGYGYLLHKFLQTGNFEEAVCVDISEESILGAEKYINYTLGAENIRINYVKEDIFSYTSEFKFNVIMAGEILEHLENPAKLLKKIYQLLIEDGYAIITTVINSPAIDHIFLYRDKNEVISQVLEAGFEIVEYQCFAAGKHTVAFSEKRKLPMNIAIIMKKRRMIK